MPSSVSGYLLYFCILIFSGSQIPEKITDAFLNAFPKPFLCAFHRVPNGFVSLFHNIAQLFVGLCHNVVQFLIRLRLSKATVMMKSSGASIGGIAAMCGYPNQLHFSRAFKKRYGVSPREWRNQNRVMIQT